MEHKVIALPRLNQLQPSMESTALKLMEETGELAQVIGKYRGLSGEHIEGYSQDEIMYMISK